MSGNYSGQKPTLILAGQRAAFTKALQAYGMTDDEDRKRVAALKMAEIIKRAPAKNFTQEQVTQGADIPSDVLALVRNGDSVAEGSEALSEDPDRLVNELQQTVDTSDQTTLGRGTQHVYAYGYHCAPDRLKVGRTDGDVVTRVARQISTSTPDKPRILLVIRTEDCRGLEMAIQGILRMRKRQVIGGGDEWYVTSRDELIDIYKTAVGDAGHGNHDPGL